MQPSLGLTQARRIADEAVRDASRLQLRISVAVADEAGALLAFARMDGAILGSIDIALAKAKTSILFNGPSENLWEFCKPGGPAPATELTNGGLIPYAGGVALNDDGGALIGAIGVSGGLPDQDGEVARAAIGKDEQ